DAPEPHPGLAWRAGTAAATGLHATSLHLPMCARAFHSFRPAEALAALHLVLRPHRRPGLMWNHRDSQDPLTRGYIEAIRAVNGEHPAERIDPDLERVVGERGFTVPRLHGFPHAQALDLDGLIGRSASASYVSKQPADLAR